jgi:CRISPR-associated protein Cas5h
MLAAILGIDYNDWFNDPQFFDFGFSLVLVKPIRKKSFAQNYVADYTKNSEVKVNKIGKYFDSLDKVQSLLSEKESLEQKEQLSKKEQKRFEGVKKSIEKSQKDFEKNSTQLEESFLSCFRSPKPIFRELILSPEYFIAINDFKYEKEIIPYLKNHWSAFHLYMGNSEFAANYQFEESILEIKQTTILDSFTARPELILFETGKKYTNLYMANKTVGNRQYRDYRNVVVCEKPITLKQEVSIHSFRTSGGTFHCEFI